MFKQSFNRYEESPIVTRRTPKTSSMRLDVFFFFFFDFAAHLRGIPRHVKRDDNATITRISRNRVEKRS